MRRRALTEVVEPPARLVAYDETDWLPLVPDEDADPEDYRCVRDGKPYGDVPAAETLRRGAAWGLWTRARHDWCEQHGWPGGLDIIDLMRQEVALVRSRGRRG